jgi:hypothetical protein
MPRLAIPAFGINAHVIRKQPVKTDLPESNFILAKLQLPLPLGAQPLIRAPRANAFVKQLRRRPLDLIPVGGDQPIFGPTANCADPQNQNQ